LKFKNGVLQNLPKMKQVVIKVILANKFFGEKLYFSGLFTFKDEHLGPQRESKK
jgi:hypothetical protein